MTDHQRTNVILLYAITTALGITAGALEEAIWVLPMVATGIWAILAALKGAADGGLQT